MTERVPTIRHFYSRRVESTRLPEFIARTDGWKHIVYALVGEDWKKIGEARTLAEAEDICRVDAEDKET